MFNIPIQLVAGSGKGVSYSSLHQIGEIVPSQTLGEGQVQVIANVATGSLMIKDHLLRIMETSGPLEIGYFYNSQKSIEGGLWRLMPTKRFISFPTSQQPSAVLVEEDGHETTYTKASDVRMYFAPGLENGTPYLKFDDVSSQWIWYHPGTHMKEIYNDQGYLSKRMDREGHQTSFEYDQSCNLVAITGDQGHRYEIRRGKTQNGGELVVICERQGSNLAILQRHEFDSQGRLLNTDMPNGYNIQYTYAHASSGLIETISQTDQTSITFTYIDGLLNQARMDNNQTKYDFDRSRYQSNRQIIFKTSSPSALEIDLDEKQDRIIQLIREEGIMGKKQLARTTYGYTDHNQLAKVIQPDGGINSYEYDQSYGLMTLIQKPDGQKVKYVYNTPTEEPQLLCEIRSLVQGQSVKPIVRRFVYDEKWDQRHLRHTFLRFEISPSGQVTEYRPDAKGFVESSRTYVLAVFDLSSMKPEISPSLSQMLSWVSQQNPQAVQLTDYAHDDRGQLRMRQSYTEVDEKGKGVNNSGRSYELTECNRFGLCTEQTVRQSDTVNTTLKKTFDVLLRLQETQDALGNKTTIQYNDEKSQTIITYPNGRTRSQIKDSRGLLKSETETVSATAEKAYQEKVIQKEIKANSQKLQRKVTVLEKMVEVLSPQQSSLQTSSSDLKQSTERERQLTYAQKQLNILKTQLSHAPFSPSHATGVQIEVLDEKTQHAVSPKQEDKKTEAKSSGASFHISTQSALEEKKESKEEKKIEQKLTISSSSVSSSLKQNQTDQTRETSYMRDHLGRITVTQHPATEDPKLHRTYTFYDQQNRLAFTVSALGHVTEFVNDPIHHYTMTVQYAQAIDPLELWVSDILPSIETLSDLLAAVKDPNQDRYQYQFLDHSGRTHYEVDAENYLTESVYDSLDRMTAKILYANPISADQLTVLKQGKTLTLTPDWTKDRRWQYQHNDDGMLVLQVDPANYAIQYNRDIGGRIIETIRYANPLSGNRITPSDQDAHTYSYYDARGQKIAEVDAEKYLTTWIYLACGLVSQMTRYANGVVDSDWEKDKTHPPKLPTTSTEDQVTVYQYDLLNRPTAVYQPYALAEMTEYDCMNHRTRFRQVDVVAPPTSTDPSHQRQTLSRYDLWDQLIAEASVYVGQKIAEVDADEKLTPEQKQETKEIIWTYMSTRHTFDPVNGLKLCSTDPVGGKTFYYYDLDQRLSVIIDPTGIATQLARNAYNQVVQTRVYSQRISDDIRATLTGGYLNSAIQQLLAQLRDDNADRVTSFQVDQRGQVVQTTSPGGYLSKNVYNAFKECVVEMKPVADKEPTLTIAHQHDGRGLEVQTTQQSGSLTTTEKQRYDNPYGQKTADVDAMGAQTVYTRDKLGRLKTTTNALSVTTSRLEYDGLSRVVKETDANNQTTQHQYNQTQRTHTTLYPVSGSQMTTQQNIFGELISTTDAYQQTQTWTRTPGGQEAHYTDALGRTRINAYGIMGQLSSQLDNQGAITSYTWNASWQLTSKTEDWKGLQYKTLYTPDAFGRNTTLVDPAQVVTQQTFDQENNLAFRIIDPHTDNHEGVHLLTLSRYQANHVKTDEVRGDAKVADQHYEKAQTDALGRPQNHIIDPVTNIQNRANALVIQEQTRHNALDLVIASVDPNQNTTRTFYDALHQKRFQIDPMGGVIEWTYTSIPHQIKSQRVYAQGIKPSLLDDDTSVETVMKMVSDKVSAGDTLQYHFYDANGQERFIAQILSDEKGQPAIIEEKRYNRNRQEVASIQYATLVPNADWSTMTTDALVTLMQDQVDPAYDRVHYRILDSVQKERFVIDSVGVVTEKRFDTMGREIMLCTYVRPVNNPAQVASLPVDQVLSQIQQDPTQDRRTYTVYDTMGNQTFIVGPEGQVTYQEYNKQNRKTLECRFNKLLQVPDSYEALLKLLSNLKPDSKIDRVKTFTYDAAGRMTVETDAMGNSDQYQYDALGNRTQHIDRNGHIIIQTYDRANRPVSTFTPTTPVTQVSYQSGQLKSTSSSLSVETRRTYDKVNQLSHIVGYGLQEARIVGYRYNACNQQQSEMLNQIAVDDPTKTASLDQRPEKIVNLLSQTIYNAKGKPVAKQALAESSQTGGWEFTVYDSQDREIYTVNALKAVVEKKYNAFGQVEKEIRYATRLDLDLSQYTQTGIPREVLEKALVVDNANDRVITYQYDLQGHKEVIKQSAIFYASPKHEAYGTAQPETHQRHNAFGECIYTEQLIAPNNWSEKRTWVDRNGKTVAMSDPNGYVTRYMLNAFGEEEKRQEYAKALSPLPDTNVTLAALDKAIASLLTPGKDKTYTTDYNLNGKSIKETQLQVEAQTIVKDKDGKAQVQDLKPQDLSRTMQYSATDQRIAITLEDGSTAYTYYGARDLVCAETKVARQSQDDKGQAITLVPLTVYGIDAFGQRVVTTRFKQGTTKPDTRSIPQPIATDPDDQTEITLMNNRGRAQYKQDPEGNLLASTYTPTSKIARTYYKVTGVVQSQDHKEYKPVIHIDEKRFQFDEFDQPVYLRVVRDNQVVQVTQSQYNTFGDTVAEGPGDGTWSLYRKCDKNGHFWNSNADSGINTITLTNLLGQETVVLQSPSTDPTKNLQAITYDQLPDLTDEKKWDPKDLEHTEKYLDAAGRNIRFALPAYYQTDPTQASNVPLEVAAGKNRPQFGQTSLSWALPQERCFDCEFLIGPLGSEPTQKLSVQSDQTYAGVDVSALPTDVYTYQINYYFNGPTQSAPQRLYVTSGKVQFETKDSKDSVNLVPIVESNESTMEFDHIVRLAGNTVGVNEVELWQNDQKVRSLNVPSDKRLNLGGFNSGTYTLKPVVSKNKLKDVQETLPFTIYTKSAAKKPLSREIPCTVKLLTLFQKDHEYGQLMWTIPAMYENNAVQLVCEYKDDKDTAYTETFTLDKKTNKGHYMDSTGKVLDCNVEFGHPILSITQISLSLQIGKNWVPLYREMSPLPADFKNPILRVLPQDRKRSVIGQSTLETKAKRYQEIVSKSSSALVSKALARAQEGKESKETKEQKTVNATPPNTIVTNSFADHIILYVTPAHSSHGNQTLKSLVEHGIKKIPLKQSKQNHRWYVNIGPAKVQYYQLPKWKSSENPQVVIQYLDVSLDLKAIWKDTPVLNSDIDQFLAFDVTGLTPGNYPYRIQGEQNTFVVAKGGLVFSSDRSKDPKTVLVPGPSRLSEYDRWSNQIGYTDSLGNKTTYEYDSRNHMVTKTEPIVEVVKPNGDKVNIAPVTKKGWDISGRNISTTDANNHTQIHMLDEEGQELAFIGGDGVTTMTNVYDVLGRTIRYADGRGKTWKQIYNHYNQLTTTITPSGLKTQYTFNETGNRATETDPAGNTRRYNFDPLGHISERYEPLGQCTLMTWDRNGKMVTVSYPDNTGMYWQRDWFGYPIDHRDLGNAAYQYQYDQKRQMTSQTSSGGSHGQYVEFGMTRGWSDLGYVEYYYPIYSAVPGQNIQMMYQLGRPVQVTDNAHHKVTVYDYNTEGRRTVAQLYAVDTNAGKILVRDAKSILDPLNREMIAIDGMATVETGYDPVGNRRKTKATISFDPKNPIIQESWNLFDNANRVVISNGILNPTTKTIEIDTNRGMKVGYTQGYRTSEIILAIDQKPLTNTITDKDDGQVAHMESTDSIVVDFDYDKVGWMKSRVEKNSYSGKTKTRTITCDADGYQLTDNTQDGGDGCYTTYTNNALGLPVHQHTQYSGEGNVHDELDIARAPYDDQKIAHVSGQRIDKYGHDYSSSQFYYDANAMLNAQRGAEDSAVPIPPDMVYSASTYDGLVLNNIYFGWDRYGWEQMMQAQSYEYFFYTVYNQLLATYGIHKHPVSSQQSRSNEVKISTNTSNILRGVGQKGGYELIPYGTVSAHAEAGFLIEKNRWFGPIRQKPQHYFDPINTFYGLGFSNQASNGLSGDERAYYYGWSRWFHTTPPPSSRHLLGSSYPPMTNETYVVNNGDTLEQIASQTQGDPSFASAIAQANGWSMSEPLKAGQILRIPQFIPQMSNAETSVPYQVLMSILIRSIAPHLNTPQPDEDFWDVLISIVVTIVACVVAPHLAPVIFCSLLPEAVAIGVTAGLIEAAEQGVLVGFGLKEHFSLVEAIETGIGAGVAKWANLADMVKEGQFLKELLMVGFVSMANQLQELALGRITQINFRSLLNAMLANFIGSKVGNLKLNPIETAVITEAIEIPTSMLITGYNPSLEMVAAQMLGTIIGNELGDIASKKIEDLRAAAQKNAQESNGYEARKNAVNQNPTNKASSTIQPKPESKARPASTEAKKSATDQSSSVTDPSEARRLLRLLGANPLSNPLEDAAADAFGMPSRYPNFFNITGDKKPAATSNSTQRPFLKQVVSDFVPEFKGEMTDKLNWQLLTLEYADKNIIEPLIRESVDLNRTNVSLLQNLKMALYTSVKDHPNLAQEASSLLKTEERLALVAKLSQGGLKISRFGAKKLAGRLGATVLGVAEVCKNPTSREVFGQIGSVAGSEAGALIGEIIALPVEALTPFITPAASIPISIAIIGTSNAIVSTAGKVFFEDVIYDRVYVPVRNEIETRQYVPNIRFAL